VDWTLGTVTPTAVLTSLARPAPAVS
jgi:hypothetical protein